MDRLIPFLFGKFVPMDQQSEIATISGIPETSAVLSRDQVVRTLDENRLGLLRLERLNFFT